MEHRETTSSDIPVDLIVDEMQAEFSERKYASLSHLFLYLTELTFDRRRFSCPSLFCHTPTMRGPFITVMTYEEWDEGCIRRIRFYMDATKSSAERMRQLLDKIPVGILLAAVRKGTLESWSQSADIDEGINDTNISFESLVMEQYGAQAAKLRECLSSLPVFQEASEASAG